MFDYAMKTIIYKSCANVGVGSSKSIRAKLGDAPNLIS